MSSKRPINYPRCQNIPTLRQARNAPRARSEAQLMVEMRVDSKRWAKDTAGLAKQLETAKIEFERVVEQCAAYAAGTVPDEYPELEPGPKA